MPQSHHSPRPRGPKRRSDSTHPPSTRRGGDRRPWPTASTTTRVSPAKPGSTYARAGTRGSTARSSQPTPATVWTSSPAPIDLDRTFPTPIVEKIVDAFSKPGGQVVLLPWPTQQQATSTKPSAADQRDVVGADEALQHPSRTGPDTEMTDAFATVESLDRSARVLRVSADATCFGPVSRPFWVDLIGETERTPTTVAGVSSPSFPGIDDIALDSAVAAQADTGLIITSLRPGHGGDHASDVVALAAARLLRVGGILAVLTHCDWRTGELIDPSGAVVAAAQNADLLFLQHIVAVHVPVHDGRFSTELLPDTDASATEQQARAAHRRIHSDVLVFAQPREYEPLETGPAGYAPTAGVLR